VFHINGAISVFLMLLLYGHLIPAKGQDPVPSTLPSKRMDGKTLILTVRGDLRPTVEKAKESALEEAQAFLIRLLQAEGIALPWEPSVEWVEQNLLSPGNPIKKETADFEGKPYTSWTIELRIDPEHLRYFRQQDRVRWGAFITGLGIALFIVIAIYYRLDDWSKGYLTKWLATGGVVLLLSFGAIWWWFHW
jgi:hypothetical protein